MVGVGRDADVTRIRRRATEQMRFPTDAELAAAIEQLPGQGEGLSGRARRHLETRRQMDAALSDLPRRLRRRDYWYLEEFEPPDLVERLSALGYERFDNAPGISPFGPPIGLDSIDPDLYQALIAAQVGEQMPDEVVVRRLSYRNPVTARMIGAGVKVGSEALETTSGVLDTAVTLRSRVRIKRAEADVARGTVGDRIEESHISVELLREQVREARLNNDIKMEKTLQEQLRTELMMQEVERGELQIARDRAALNMVQKQQILYDRFVAAGKLAEADAIKALPSGDAAALVDLALRGPVQKWVDEDDTEVDDSSIDQIEG